MSRMLLMLVRFGALVVLAGAARADVAVTLRASAAVTLASGEGPRAVTLADVAVLDPPTTEEAARLAEIVVLPGGGIAASAGVATVSVADVRSALDAAHVLWARTTLRGSSCVVTIARVGGETERPSVKMPVRVGLSQVVPQMADVGDATGPGGGGGGGGARTVRQAVSARLAELYAVDAADLRLAFDGADEEFLSQGVVRAGVVRRVDAQPNGTGSSARTPVSIVIYEADRIVAARTVGTQALINRTVVVARGAIGRGQAVTAESVEVGRQWIAPSTRAPVTAEEAIGQIASRPIAAGAVVTSADVTTPIACKRGDIVWVHALSGGLTVKAKCRAQGQARDGEMVQLKLEGSGKPITARMSGMGRAVMVVE